VEATNARISPRQVRHKQIVKDAIQGKSYESIAKENGLNPKFPRQDVYRVLQSPASQAELRHIAEKTEYTVDKCLEEIAEAQVMAKKHRQTTALVSALALKAKVAGLMIEKYQDITDRSSLRTEAESTLSSLGVSDAGISPLSASSSDCEPMQAQVKDSHEQD
jgi:hypothetical protein